MSIAALRWAFRLEMRDPSAKAVLIALAEHANEQWACWPSVARLCRFTSLCERAVRSAMHRLAAAGVITMAPRPGRTPLYTLAGDAPPPRHEPHLTPAAGAPESPRTPTEPPGECHAPSSDCRGTRLAADWRPGPDERRYALERGLDPDLLAEEFRNYWCALPGARGRKLDWAATFRNRCLQRSGVRHRGVRREGVARGADGVAASAERVLRRRGLDLA